jgi:predicted transcriptional regulator
MDMNLRVPEDSDRRPDELTAKARTPKSALLRQVAKSDAQRRRRSQDISAGLEFALSHNAGLLKRLEDA